RALACVAASLCRGRGEIPVAVGPQVFGPEGAAAHLGMARAARRSDLYAFLQGMRAGRLAGMVLRPSAPPRGNLPSARNHRSKISRRCSIMKTIASDIRMIDAITPLVVTLDEAPNIARTLDKLTWARRIVIVDSGSVDGTIEILKRYPQV